MEETELRIGNFLKYNYEGKDCFGEIVLGLGNFDLAIKDLGFVKFRGDCEGIPLTPEILEKAGFKKETVDHILEGKIFVYFLPGSKWVENFGILFEDRKFQYCELGEYVERIGVELLYVHQIQNLYFALTREELNIEL